MKSNDEMLQKTTLWLHDVSVQISQFYDANLYQYYLYLCLNDIMATADYLSIISTPPGYSIQYTDISQLDTFHNIATQNIIAYNDGTNQPVDLVLGASRDVKIETLSNIDLYIPDTGEVKLFNTLYTNGVRTDTEILNFSAYDNITLISGGVSSNIVKVTGTDEFHTTIVGDLKLQSRYDNEIISTSLSNIFFTDNVVFTSNVFVSGDTELQNTYVAGNLVSLGNFYGKNMNLLKIFTSNAEDAPEQVGYAFRIAESNQLEIVRYTKYSSNMAAEPILKRVAVFGNYRNTGPSEASDVNNYLVFDEFNGLSIASDPDPLVQHVTTRYQWRFNSNADIYSSVRVGVNTENPEYELDVNGTIKTINLRANNIMSDSVQTTSDIRLKTKLDQLKPIDALEKVNKLELIKYTFNENPSETKTGFVAQQVKQIIDEAVVVKEAKGLSDCHLVDNTVLIAYLVGSVQELSKKLEELQQF